MKRANLLILFAWLLHAASWFVPVIKGFTPSLRGWQAFLLAATSALRPSEGVVSQGGNGVVLASASVATTLLFIFGSPWAVLRNSRTVQLIAAWTAAIGFVLNSHWCVISGSMRSDLTVGYFFWWLSFALIAVGFFDLARSESKKSATAQRAGAAL